MLKIFASYAHIISSYKIKKFDQFGRIYRLKAEILFIDHSILYLRETVFDFEKRKYAYHWQDADGLLIIRWDNAPDWEVDTFPHHRHMGKEGRVELSFERTLEQVLKFIADKIR